MKLKLGYPTLEEEEQMLAKVGDEIPYEEVESQFNPEQIQEMQRDCRKVYVDPSILQYITKLAHETRNHPFISIGVSPRASKALYKTAKTWAFLNDRDFVVPDDVKEMLVAVWSHRLILKTEARMNEMNPEEILEDILNNVHLPQEQLIRI